MAFSNNQVRHLFVAADPKASNAALVDLGDTAVRGVVGEYLYVEHWGPGGVVASDKIYVPNIMYAKLTDGAKLATPLHKHTVAVSTATDGQVYNLKVTAFHYIGLGEQDQVTRVGTFRAPASSTTSAIAAGLRKALRASLGFMINEDSAEADASAAGNINNYKEQIFTVTGSSANVVISEIAPYWELGKFPAGRVTTIPENAVFLGPIADASGVLDNKWATVTYAANGTAGDATKKLADLEYFCMGARGDEYRGMGYPYNLTTQYEVNLANEYDVIDIHYAYVGSNESCQKSEKDLTILVPNNNTTLAGYIDTLTGFADGDPRRLIPSGSGNGA